MPLRPTTPPPIVVDGDVLDGEGGEHDDRTSPVLGLASFDHRAAEHPFGVANAAVEPPAAVDPIAVAIARGAAGRKERDCGLRYVSVLEHFLEPGLRQERTERRNRGGSDHRAPAAGQVVIGQRLQHQHLGDGVGFGAAHLRGELQPEHAGPDESLNCLRGQRSQLLALWTGGAQRLADAVDGIQKKSPFGCPFLGKRLRHCLPPWPRSVFGAVIILSRRMRLVLHDARTREALVSPTDTGSGGFTHKFFRVARSREDVVAQRIAAWARMSYGWMGRSPDYKAALMNTLGANHSFYGKFSDNAKAWYRRAQDHVLFMNHAIVNPPVDRARPADQVKDVFIAQPGTSNSL